MRTIRRPVVILCGLGYWIWATAALAAALVARAASENPPSGEERLLLGLALVSWLAASLIALGAALGRRGHVLVGLWTIQTAVLVAAVVSTLDPGGIRIAPPLIALGLAGQIAGLVAAGVPQPRLGDSTPPAADAGTRTS